MIRPVIVILILIAGCNGPPLAMAQQCYNGSRSHRSHGHRSGYGYAPYRGGYRSFDYAPQLYRFNPFYTPNPDTQVQAAATLAYRWMLENQANQQQQEIQRLRQQVQQAQTYQPQPQAAYGQKQPAYGQQGAAPPATGGTVTFSGTGQIQGGPIDPNVPPTQPPANDLTQRVAELFKKSCTTCHNAQKLDGGIDLSGNPDQIDPLIAFKSSYQVDIRRMPKKAPPLEDEDANLLKEWLSTK